LVGGYGLRAGPPGGGVGLEVPLTSEDDEPHGIYLPRGLAHGFLAETAVLMHYLVEEYHTGEDEFGVAWDDPDAGIRWGTTDPILSERDRSNPKLAEVLRSPPAFEEEAPSMPSGQVLVVGGAACVACVVVGGLLE